MDIDKEVEKIRLGFFEVPECVGATYMAEYMYYRLYGEYDFKPAVEICERFKLSKCMTDKQVFKKISFSWPMFGLGREMMDLLTSIRIDFPLSSEKEENEQFVEDYKDRLWEGFKAVAQTKLYRKLAGDILEEDFLKLESHHRYGVLEAVSERKADILSEVWKQELRAA